NQWPGTPRQYSSRTRAFEKLLLGEAHCHRAVGPHHQGTSHQGGKLCDQGLPLRIRPGRLALIRQITPSHRGAVHQFFPTTQFGAPARQVARRQRMLTVVGEHGRHTAFLQPLTRLDAGAALGQAIHVDLSVSHVETPFLFCMRLAITTNTATSNMKRVASALISGLRPRRTRENTSRGSVVYRSEERRVGETAEAAERAPTIPGRHL